MPSIAIAVKEVDARQINYGLPKLLPHVGNLERPSSMPQAGILIGGASPFLDLFKEELHESVQSNAQEATTASIGNENYHQAQRSNMNATSRSENLSQGSGDDSVIPTKRGHTHVFNDREKDNVPDQSNLSIHPEDSHSNQKVTGDESAITSDVHRQPDDVVVNDETISINHGTHVPLQGANGSNHVISAAIASKERNSQIPKSANLQLFINKENSKDAISVMASANQELSSDSSLNNEEAIIDVIKEFTEAKDSLNSSNKYRAIQVRSGKGESTVDITKDAQLTDNVSLTVNKTPLNPAQAIDKYSDRSEVFNALGVDASAGKDLMARNREGLGDGNAFSQRNVMPSYSEAQGQEKSLLSSIAALEVKRDNRIFIQQDQVSINESAFSSHRGDLAFPLSSHSSLNGQNIISVQRETFVDEVADLLPMAVNNGSGRLKLIVTPPHLGSLDVNIVVRANTVHIVITADTHEVQQLIQGNSEQLKNALQQQGLMVDSFDVFLENGRFGSHGESGGREAFLRHASQDRMDGMGTEGELSQASASPISIDKGIPGMGDSISIFA